MTDPVLGDLSWSEQAIVRRIRLGWTKASLSDACGVSRVTLWRVMECKDDARRMEPTDRVRALVDAALDEAERSANGTESVA